jgi:hypothetical protein
LSGCLLGCTPIYWWIDLKEWLQSQASTKWNQSENIFWRSVPIQSHDAENKCSSWQLPSTDSFEPIRLGLGQVQESSPRGWPVSLPSNALLYAAAIYLDIKIYVLEDLQGLLVQMSRLDAMTSVSSTAFMSASHRKCSHHCRNQSTANHNLERKKGIVNSPKSHQTSHPRCVVDYEAAHRS